MHCLCCFRIQSPGQPYTKPTGSTIPPVRHDQPDSPVPAAPLELEEYRALRAVIGQRGSLRVVLVVSTLAGWALAASLVTTLVALPLASLIPLIVLVAGFEAVHALHVGAERIGRYLYVRYESAGSPMWEGAIGAFGSGRLPFGGRPSGAHFAAVFALAALTNLAAAALGSTPVELGTLAAIHALVVARIVLARAASKNQRRDDQAEFERILGRGDRGNVDGKS